MGLDWQEVMEGFESAMDGVAAVHNICKAATEILYTAAVLSTDEDKVVLMLDTALWAELDNQISMFLAYMDMANREGE